MTVRNPGNCSGCHRPMRTRSTPLAQRPGSIICHTARMCQACWQEKRRKEAMSPERIHAMRETTRRWLIDRGFPGTSVPTDDYRASA